jgi:hypothetical protein
MRIPIRYVTYVRMAVQALLVFTFSVVGAALFFADQPIASGIFLLTAIQTARD